MLRTLSQLTCCGCSPAMLRVFCTHTPLPGCLVATLVHSLCVCDLCRVRVLVRLSHPRPPDRNQHGCTVGVLPGPTRVLPMPRQYGIGRRAPNSCCAELCCVVVSGGGVVHVVVWIVSSIRFVMCPLALLLDMVTAMALSILRDTSHHSWLISLADTTDFRL